MQIGEPSFIKCPHCGEKKEYYPGPFFVNFYGLTEWSDGETFKSIPSTKETKLQFCHYCNQYYWYSIKLERLTFTGYVEAAAYFEKKYSQKTLNNYLFKSRNKRRLLYIRLNILRRYNDQFRVYPYQKEDNSKNIVISEENKDTFINNAKLLIDLLTELGSNNYLLIAELYRNIGDFESAKKSIDKLKDIELKELLLNEIEQKNCNVIIIKKP